MCNRSAVFTAYNTIRSAARRSPGIVDLTRLNRALGIVQSGKAQVEDTQYQATPASCGCKDYEYRNAARRRYTGPCKHMLAAALLEMAEVAA